MAMAGEKDDALSAISASGEVGSDALEAWVIFRWLNYSDLTRPIYPKWWFSQGNSLISGKSRLVKYFNLARMLVSIHFKAIFHFNNYGRKGSYMHFT